MDGNAHPDCQQTEQQELRPHGYPKQGFTVWDNTKNQAFSNLLCSPSCFFEASEKCDDQKTIGPDLRRPYSVTDRYKQ